MFWPARPIGESFNESLTALRKTAGAPKATSTSEDDPTPSRTAVAKAFADSAEAGFIFQLPAMKILRVIMI
jgi:hypothetical protein